MAGELTNDVEELRKRLKLDAQKAAKTAATPRERLVLAVTGRNPDGYTEVLAADVVSVAATVAEDDHTDYTRALATSALVNLNGAGNKPLPEHQARAVLIHPTTRALIQLIERSKS